MKMTYPDLFEQLWLLYPKRIGGNPKRKAFNAYKARLREGVLYDDLKSAVLRYYKFCKATGKIDTEWTQRASTFFGAQGEAWLEDWEPPEIKQEWEKIPSDNEKLWDWANKHNFSGPGSLTYYQYRGELQKEVEKRIAQTR